MRTLLFGAVRLMRSQSIVPSGARVPKKVEKPGSLWDRIAINGARLKELYAAFREPYSRHRRVVPLSDTSFPVVSQVSFVAESATLAGDVLVGDKANIWYNCVIRGDLGPVTIGAFTNVQDSTTIVTTGTAGVTIEDSVTIGHHAYLQGCTVGKEGFIGMNSKVLEGAVVEPLAMVAANAVVPPGTRIPTGELWGGVPARKLRNLTEDEKEQMASWAQEYSNLADEHKTLQEPGSLVYTQVEKIRSQIGEGPFVNKYDQ